MGLFGDAAARMLRTSWKGVQDLAQELNAIFNSNNIDLEPRSIVINQPEGATLPPIQINQPVGSTVSPIQITKGDITTTFGGQGGGGGGAGIDLGDIQFPDQNPADKPQAVPPPSLNPVSLHGVVIGKLGGVRYSVRCYARNPSTAPPIGILPVEFPDVDAGETIPNGSICPVIMFLKLNGQTVQPDGSIGYVAVWREEPT